MFNCISSPEIEYSDEFQNISRPSNVLHNYHAVIDPKTKKIIGLPAIWEKVINDSIPIQKRTSLIVAAIKAVDFMENGVDANDNSLTTQISENEATSPSLHEKKQNTFERKESLKSSHYKNITVKSHLSTINSEEEILGEMRKVCFHKDSNAFAKYKIVEQKIGEGASGILYQ